MKNPIGRLVAVGLVAAITLAVTVGAASAWPPKGSFLIDGKLEHPMLLSTEEIADLLATTNPHVYTVTFQAGTAVETHTFTGYLLYDVLTFLGPKFDPAVRNDKLQFYATATGLRQCRSRLATSSPLVMPPGSPGDWRRPAQGRRAR